MRWGLEVSDTTGRTPRAAAPAPEAPSLIAMTQAHSGLELRARGTQDWQEAPRVIFPPPTWLYHDARNDKNPPPTPRTTSPPKGQKKTPLLSLEGHCGGRFEH